MKKSVFSTKAIWAYSLFTIICLVISSFITYSQKIADFSGEWILDRSLSKSYLTEVATSSIVISQNEWSLTMDITISPDNHQPLKRTENYVLNTSIAKKVASPEEKSIHIDTKLAPDGQSFTIAETISYTKDGVPIKFQRIDTYSISKDRKTLTIETYDILPENSGVPKDQQHEIRVYNKKI